jgi:hypothetical protein
MIQKITLILINIISLIELLLNNYKIIKLEEKIEIMIEIIIKIRRINRLKISLN